MINAPFTQCFKQGIYESRIKNDYKNFEIPGILSSPQGKGKHYKTCPGFLSVPKIKEQEFQNYFCHYLSYFSIYPDRK